MVDSGHAEWLLGASMTTPRAAVLCAALLSAFAAVSFFAARAESPTFDEPVQTVAGWTHLHLGDFRMNVEDPPLWEEWAALPNGRDALHPDPPDLSGGGSWMHPRSRRGSPRGLSGRRAWTARPS